MSDDDCVESDDVATDGGTVRRETPQTAATEHPTKVCIDLFSGLGGFSAAFADADDAPRHLDFCDECVGETLHYRDETDGMWTCPSCGRWSA